MEMKQNASAGTTESSDILIMIEPNGTDGLQLELDSSVEKQFGQQIRKKILDTLEKLAVMNAKIKAVDKGALDCTIEARTVAAVYRAAQEETIDWQVIQSWNA
ncbi:citrate lyase acyl carrier protein [Enterococcus termitis]|uniref:Citrate lyase acyl carrier protein n=1 Tax=Enterococcus termitis TaxID=332950 RepID=A0A1E5H6W9_9ENTE|nr:citrate lyase acyl carrier protein [Enterococcus termitis]OEG20596.1 citrate lyase acyl carrier protein [Enterococcus termitis]OJG99840.1 citrate lyase acyl carrier protein [Enterococcus termitis]